MSNKNKELSLEVRKSISRGVITDYAVTNSEIHDLSIQELAEILKAIGEALLKDNK